jgi:hypothetical protein
MASKWWQSLIGAIPGVGPILEGVIGLGSKMLGNERREKRLDAELADQKIKARARRRRALIKASPWPLRLFSFGSGMAPFFAPLLPGVSIAATTAYVDQVINGMPDWYIRLVLLMYGFIWGGSEWKALVAQRDDERLDEKEVESKGVRQTMSGGEPEGWDYDH